MEKELFRLRNESSMVESMPVGDDWDRQVDSSLLRVNFHGGAEALKADVIQSIGKLADKAGVDRNAYDIGGEGQSRNYVVKFKGATIIARANAVAVKSAVRSWSTSAKAYTWDEITVPEPGSNPARGITLQVYLSFDANGKQRRVQREIKKLKVVATAHASRPGGVRIGMDKDSGVLMLEQQMLARIKMSGPEARVQVSWNEELADKYCIDTAVAMAAFEGSSKAREPAQWGKWL